MLIPKRFKKLEIILISILTILYGSAIISKTFSTDFHLSRTTLHKRIERVREAINAYQNLYKSCGFNQEASFNCNEEILAQQWENFYKWDNTY